jgi:hypothetical protein
MYQMNSTFKASIMVAGCLLASLFRMAFTASLGLMSNKFQTTTKLVTSYKKKENYAHIFT